MTRLSFSMLFVALLAQTSAAMSYTFTSTYTSNFPGGEGTVEVLGTFDWDLTNGVTNFQATSIDVNNPDTGLVTPTEGYILDDPSLTFTPSSKTLTYTLIADFGFVTPNFGVDTIKANSLTFKIPTGPSIEVEGSTVVECVPVPSSIAMLGTLAATVGCGTWLKRRRKV